MDKKDAVFRLIVEGIYPKIAHKLEVEADTPDASYSLHMYGALECMLQSFPKIGEAIANQDKAQLMELFQTVVNPETVWAVPPSQIARLAISRAPLFSPDLFEVDSDTEAHIWKILQAIIKFLQ